VRYLPDGKRLIWFGDDKQSLSIADLQKGRVVQTIPIPPGMQSITISPDGSRYALGTITDTAGDRRGDAATHF